MIESLAKIGCLDQTGRRRRTLVVEGVGGVVSDDARRISAGRTCRMFIANSARTGSVFEPQRCRRWGQYICRGSSRMHERRSAI